MKIFNICVLWNIICHFLQDSTLSFKAEFLRLEKSTKKHNNCLSKFRADSKKWIYRKRIKITRTDQGIFLSEKEIINKLEDLLDIKISAIEKNNLYKMLRNFLKKTLKNLLNYLLVQNDVINHIEALEPPYAQQKASNFVKIARQLENCILSQSWNIWGQKLWNFNLTNLNSKS